MYLDGAWSKWACNALSLVLPLKAGTHRPNRWTSEAFGETRTRSGTFLFRRCRLRLSMRSLRRRAVGLLFHWIIWLVVCWMAVLIGGLLENQRGVWEGGILCALCFSMDLVPSFAVFMLCSTGTRPAFIMSVQDKLIYVHLVMPCCMFSMQLFLLEIVKFRFDRK